MKPNYQIDLAKCLIKNDYKIINENVLQTISCIPFKQLLNTWNTSNFVHNPINVGIVPMKIHKNPRRSMLQRPDL